MYGDIPEEIKTLAQGDQYWCGLMSGAFDIVEREHFMEERPRFFNGYTDHSPRHIIEVIISAWDMVSDETRKSSFSAADASAMAITCLLHDIAMHVGEAGFKSLIQPGCHWKPLKGWGETPWCDLWRDFLAEAKRLDGKRLIDIFGARERGKEAVIRQPPLGEGTMATDDCLLVGEFLRRHHPRLAHEIAVYGFPAADGKTVRILPDHCDAETADLLGLIARSHGLPLRAAVSKVQRPHEHRHRFYEGTHPVFLMTLLRIGDYLQLQRERAPNAALKYRPLMSPQSQAEWNAHDAVREILRAGGDDPESLFVRAKPQSVAVFFKVRSWLDGIQQELDQCWAVLGEVYGRYPDQNLGLSIRRVRSNLDDCERFADESNYLPERVAFTTAGGPLLKLLVGPLYGDELRYGIRELMQNAVDAVRERYALCEQEPDLAPAPPAKGTTDEVIVSIDMDDVGEPVSVTVTDIGMGMTLDILRDYFLRAGASFRDSSLWRRDFTDDHKHATIPRTGRFGIGALAAFLIGDKIEVCTRHQRSAVGLRFTTSLDDSLIEVSRVEEDVPVGTTIKVTALKDPRKLKAMTKAGVEGRSAEWDYFCGHWPRVKRVAGAENFPQSVALPSGDGWWQIRHEEVASVFVRWRKNSGIVVCNDILVNKIPVYSLDGRSALPHPELIVVDRDGNLPLTLRRTEFSGPLPFHDELVATFIRDFLARLLAWGPTDNHSETVFFLGLMLTWALLPDGLAVSQRAILQKCGVKSILFVGAQSGAVVLPAALPESAVMFSPHHGESISALGYYANADAVEGRIASVSGRWKKHPNRGLMRVVDGDEFPWKATYDLANICAPNQMAVQVFLGEEGDINTSFMDIWMNVVHHLVLSCDPGVRRQQLAHLLADDEFAAMVAFYEKVPVEERPTAIVVGSPVEAEAAQ